jgi:hypothetical protein
MEQAAEMAKSWMASPDTKTIDSRMGSAEDVNVERVDGQSEICVWETIQ